MLGKRRYLKSTKSENDLSITLVIATHNEEKVIKEKIENSLYLDYPKDKLEIIVASDASIDKTNEIVESYSQKGIKLYDQKEHQGKSAALNYVVSNIAKGDIVVFNDATTFMERNSLRNISSYFANARIGSVAGKLIFRGHSDSVITKNYSLYWRYEEFLRKSESEIGYLPFVSGAFYAIRRNLYTPVPVNLPDDSVSPLGVYKQGYAVFYANDALAHETGAENAADEFKIKSRGVVRELGSIWYFKELLNPLRYPMLSFVLISHRLLRWAVSIFLIVIFFINLVLLKNFFYRTFFYFQAAFYFVALCGLLVKRNFPVVNIAFYFCLVNAAALWGIIEFLFGQRQATWKPVR